MGKKYSYRVEGGNIYYNDEGVIQFADMSVTSADIPGVIEGISVTALGERAFMDCNCLRSITLLEGITGIGGMAFSGCMGLTDITIPRSVKIIGKGRLLSMYLPDSCQCT